MQLVWLWNYYTFAFCKSLQMILIRGILTNCQRTHSRSTLRRQNLYLQAQDSHCLIHLY